MELPQYIQKENPSAAVLQEAHPNVDYSGLERLSNKFTGFIDGLKKYKDTLDTENAYKEYKLWLAKEQRNLEENTSFEELAGACEKFNADVPIKIEAVLNKTTLSWKDKQELSTKWKVQEQPAAYINSMRIADGIKRTTFITQQQAQTAEKVAAFSNASFAQLAGNNGWAMLEDANNMASNQAIAAYQNNFITKAMIPAYTQQIKQENTVYWVGAMTEKNPGYMQRILTGHNEEISNLRANIYASSGGKYLTISSKNNANYKNYISEINTLSAQDKAMLYIGNITVKDGKQSSTITGSAAYDLGGIQAEAKKLGISFKDAIHDPQILAKYATPFSSRFTADSIYYNETNKDLAGLYYNGEYLPPSMNSNSRFFTPMLKYATIECRNASLAAIDTYLSAEEKEKLNKEKLENAKNVWALNKDLQNEILHKGDIPTQTIYPTRQDTTGIEIDPVHKANTLRDVEHTIPVGGNKKSTVYLMTKQLPELQRRLGFKIITTSDYRVGSKGHHGEGRAVDVQMRGYTSEQKIKLVTELLKLSTVHMLGTSDPIILNYFKNNPKIEDERERDKKLPPRNNHVNHIHITTINK